MSSKYRITLRVERVVVVDIEANSPEEAWDRAWSVNPSRPVKSEETGRDVEEVVLAPS